MSHDRHSLVPRDYDLVHEGENLRIPGVKIPGVKKIPDVRIPSVKSSSFGKYCRRVCWH